jgi:hypothetical protein
MWACILNFIQIPPFQFCLLHLCFVARSDKDRLRVALDLAYGSLYLATVCSFHLTVAKGLAAPSPPPHLASQLLHLLAPIGLPAVNSTCILTNAVIWWIGCLAIPGQWHSSAHKRGIHMFCSASRFVFHIA